MVLTPVLRYDTSTVHEYTVLCSTVPAYVLYGTSTVQPYKYRQEKGLSTVQYGTVVLRKGVRYATRGVLSDLTCLLAFLTLHLPFS